ncbi:hypothetical protein [Gracilibacillus sp. JCM 18860]
MERKDMMRMKFIFRNGVVKMERESKQPSLESKRIDQEWLRLIYLAKIQGVSKKDVAIFLKTYSQLKETLVKSKT